MPLELMESMGNHSGYIAFQLNVGDKHMSLGIGGNFPNVCQLLMAFSIVCKLT